MSIRNYFDRDIRLRHLRLLVAIDDAGQLTRAARALNITQPALSKALAEVERSIGEPLFERTTKGLVANRNGAIVVQAARHALDELERASGELLGLNASETRTLAVGVMPTTAMAFLGDAIALLSRRNPSWVVRLVDGPMPQLLPQLLAGRLQLIVGGQIRSATPEGVQAMDLYDDTMKLAVAAEHPLAGAAAPTWNQLIEYPWVLPPPGNAIRTSFSNALRINGMAMPSRVIEALSVDLILALMDSAMAVNLMPGRLATALQKLGWITIISGDHEARLGLSLPVKIFVPAGQTLAPAVTEMIACVRKCLRGT